MHVMERGGFVMWPLLILSILTVTFSIERFFFWQSINGRGRSQRFRRLIEALRENRRDTLRALVDKDTSPYGIVASEMMEHGASDAVAVAAVEAQRPRIDRFMGLLSTTITVAPMLGILGTVTGIIKSFKLLGGEGTMIDPRELSGGIGEALVATASGLIVAILAVFPYMAFRAQIDRAMGKLESVIASAKTGLKPQSESRLEDSSVKSPKLGEAEVNQLLALLERES